MRQRAGAADLTVRRILVAIKDPAARELPSVRKAAQLARAWGAELLLFQALPAPRDDLEGQLAATVDAADQVRGAALAALAAITVRLRRRRVPAEVAAEWDYPAYDAIIRAGQRAKADLIVAEQHAGWRLGLLHQNDRELLRLSPLPVLLVKRTDAYRRPVVLAALDPDHSFAKPVRLDGVILRAGAKIAAALHGALHAVHAYPPLPVNAFPRGAVSQDAVERAAARSAKAARERLARAVRGAAIPPSRRHLIARHPTDAIEEAATGTGSSIVVMGAIARSGLKRLLIGNTAEKVLSRIACDVLVVKPRGFVRRQSPPNRITSTSSPRAAGPAPGGRRMRALAAANTDTSEVS